MSTATIATIAGCIALLAIALAFFAFGYGAGWRAAKSQDLDRRVDDVLRRVRDFKAQAKGDSDGR